MSPVPAEAVAPAPESVPPFRYTPDMAERIELKWQQYWDDNATFRTSWPGAQTPSDQAQPAQASANPDASKPHKANPNVLGQPYFIMDMFPYPSGAGLHVGHPLGFIATDVMGRFRRMCGDNVLHALSYDAFGLPAEQFAMQTGQHPRTSTAANIANMQRQLHRMGLAHDPQRSFATYDPDYVRWTQWIFVQIFNSWYDTTAVNPSGSMGRARPIAQLIELLEQGQRPVPGGFDFDTSGDNAGGQVWKGLTDQQRRQVIDAQRMAYVDESPVNWCPGLGTVLANEEVIDGKSERGNFPVFVKALRQWKMRITAYGDRLTDDLEDIDWPDAVKQMQRNWIGRSTGATLRFSLADAQAEGDAQAGDKAQTRGIEVFTTRPDTLYGATFMVVAPEHGLLDQLASSWPAGTRPAWTGGYDSPQEAVRAYQLEAAAKTADQRTQADTSKTGVFTGHMAINPMTGQAIPVFTADYVLMGYGTGAIMAVPGGDSRDFDFAQAYDIPVVHTVAPEGGLPQDFQGAWTADGQVINSPASTPAQAAVSASGTASATRPASSPDTAAAPHSAPASPAPASAPDTAEAPGPVLNGMSVAQAHQVTCDWLEAAGIGRRTTTYRLRDWLFSRQRYWGEPFPIVWDQDGSAHALPVEALPVALPDVPNFAPRTFDPQDVDSLPEAPLGRSQEWVNVTLDLGDGPKPYRRDTNTMPNWAGSCWYYLRYLDPSWSPRDPHAPVVDPQVENYWMSPGHNKANPAGGVDLYVGGVEHAVLHLLYARFWHKVLFDLGFVSSREPFAKLFNQGYIQAFAYTDQRGAYVPAAEVTGDEAQGYRWQGEEVFREYGKMGKSLKNVVTPDDLYKSHGADTFRLYEMSMGPLDVSRPWNTRDVVGAQRFLQRLWRNVVDEVTGQVTVVDSPASLETRKAVHRAIADVRTELEAMRPNTAISKLITLNNHLTGLDQVPREAIEPLVLMVAPLAPHIAEELWSRLGHEGTLTYHPFPQADPRYLVQETVTCVIQIKGKLRSRMEVAPDISAQALEAAALADEAIVRAIDGQQVRKVIVKAPGLVNIVV